MYSQLQIKLRTINKRIKHIEQSNLTAEQKLLLWQARQACLDGLKLLNRMTVGN